MKFSVLLPTRNRLDLLKYAMTSVLKQNYDNWEVIVSDNASNENIEGYINSLKDSRIKYDRSEEFISVTDNWNRCLNQSTGDYVIMLGDDDILLKKYFQITRKLIENFQQPDLIYTNAYLYAYPGVLPDFPKGLFRTYGSLNAMPKHASPFWLDLSTRLAIVQQMLRFRMVFGTNMQHALIHRTLIEKIKRQDKFFHSPYPDYYAMPVLFMEAERTLIYPEELVVIGISPKSHGYYFFNKKDKEGADFLNIQKEMNAISNIQSILLPGSDMLTFWLGAMELLKQHFPLEQYNLKLEYQKYRQQQIYYILQKFLNDKETFRGEFTLLINHLTFSEKLLIVFPRFAILLLKRMFPKFFKRACKKIIHSMKRVSSAKNPICSTIKNPPKNSFSNPLEILEQVEPIDCLK